MTNEEMSRAFNVGDKVICRETGVIGTVLEFYTPTASCEQTMVRTEDGERYHAPTHVWVRIGIDFSTQKDFNASLLNPYGEYLCKFAENHGMSVGEAAKQAIVKARYEYFCKTGC